LRASSIIDERGTRFEKVNPEFSADLAPAFMCMEIFT